MTTNNDTNTNWKEDLGEIYHCTHQVEDALRILFNKAGDQLNEAELKWFAEFSHAAAYQANDLARGLESLFCHINEKGEVDDGARLLYCLSHHAYAIAGMAGIGASAAHRLIHHEMHVEGGAQ